VTHTSRELTDGYEYTVNAPGSDGIGVATFGVVRPEARDQASAAPSDQPRAKRHWLDALRL
jgi:hypothetical protein